MNHDRFLPFLAPPRRKQRQAADAVQRSQISPVRVGLAGHMDAGESHIHGGADTLSHEGQEGSGVGLGFVGSHAHGNGIMTLPFFS